MKSDTLIFEYPIPFSMRPIPEGTFLMGSPEDDKDAFDWEKGQHLVKLDSFYLGQYPVTQALYEAVMAKNPSHFQGSDRPVEKVSWFDAAIFCNRLNELYKEKGYAACYFEDKTLNIPLGSHTEALKNETEVYIDWEAKGFRLPTEAQWEYAARGGEKGAKANFTYAGSNKLKEVAWFDTNSHSETKPVGKKAPNPLGLFDMTGNVWEWCQDWMDYDLYKKRLNNGEVVENPVGPDKGSARVRRGGSWRFNPQRCRVAARGNARPAYRGNSIGFRLVLCP